MSEIDRKRYPHTCYCSAPALMLGTSIECSSSKCRFFVSDFSEIRINSRSFDGIMEDMIKSFRKFYIPLPPPTP